VTTTWTTVEERIVWTATEDPSYKFETLRPRTVSVEGGGGGASALADLTDVDVTTDPPAVDDVLAWDGTDWTPATLEGGAGGGGGAVDSVNGETGVVVLDAADVGADPAGTAATAVGAIPSDGSAATPSLRTLGTGAQQAAPGNDGRLSDARTPSDGSVTAAKFATNVLDTDSTMAADSDTRVPSQKAVKAALAERSMFTIPQSGAWMIAPNLPWNGVGSGPPAAPTTNTQNLLIFVPFVVSEEFTLDRMGSELTAANSAGTVRLGIYTSDSHGQPDSLVLNAGTHAATATGSVAITGLSQVLLPGRYYAALVCQGLNTGGTNPAFRSTYGSAWTATTFGSGFAATQPSGNVQPGYQFQRTGVSGSLPATAGATRTSLSTANPLFPMIHIRRA